MISEDEYKALILKAISIIPAVAVLAVLASSYAAGAPDVIAARIHGGPPGPDHTLSWRVVVVLRDRGFYEPVPNLPLSLEAGKEKITGITDQEGAWESRLPWGPTEHRPAQQIPVTIRRLDSGATLLSHPVAIRPSAWHESMKRVPPQVTGRRSGQLHIDLFLLRAAAATSFPEQALLRVSHDHAPVSEAKLSLSGDGLSFDPDPPQRTDREGRARLRILPSFPAPSLEIHATAPGGETGTFECALPTRTGALWIDPDKLANGTVFVASPVRHRQAYLTFFTQQARLLGLRMPLEDDGVGGATGSMLLPPMPHEPAWVLVSPDPPGAGGEQDVIAWPIITSTDPPPTEAAHVSTPLLADGMPQALAASKDRSHAGRLRAMLILAAAALIESSLIWLRARQAKRNLEMLIASNLDIDETVSRALLGGSRFWIRMLTASLLVALGFGALAFVTWVGA